MGRIQGQREEYDFGIEKEHVVPVLLKCLTQVVEAAKEGVEAALTAFVRTVLNNSLFDWVVWFDTFLHRRSHG